MKVLVSGGAGYIGSHFVRLLSEQQIETVVLDNLSGGHRDAVPSEIPFVRCDIGDRQAVRAALQKYHPTAVVHFAGLIQVGESMAMPNQYFGVNLVQTLALMDEVVHAGIGQFVFSSTAAVYGVPQQVPIPEDHCLRPINPYGASKLAVELALDGYGKAFGLRHAALRYFNAAGAHPSGSLVERHHPETHLIPLAIDAVLGTGPALTVFGEDWPTPDGTCIRDYIHVQDLAAAHLLALEALEKGSDSMTLNLGTGRGISIREILSTVGLVAKAPVPFCVGARRPGDPPSLVAAVSKAEQMLGWTAGRSDVHTLIEDAVRSRRPH